MATNWLEIDGIASIAVAVGTLSLAAVTVKLANNARSQVDASFKEATATEALAQEAKTDRQLAWRPQLELLRHGQDEYGDWHIEVANSGAGPAIDVVVVARLIDPIHTWTLVRLGDLRPGVARKKEQPSWPYGNSIASIFDGYPDLDGRRTVVVVMICRDILERRFRFAVAAPISAYPGEPNKILRVEESTLSVDNPSHSGWASEPLIWG